MPGPNDSNNQPPNDNPNPGGAPPPGGDPPPPNPPNDPPNPPSPPPSGKESKVITMPTAAMSAIKREEREKGKKEAMATLDKEARRVGFKSHADMIASLQARRSRGNKPPSSPPNDPPTPNAPAGTPAPPADASAAELARLRRENQRLKDQAVNKNKRVAIEQKRRRALQKAADAREAEGLLRESAIRAGVRDVDYALHLIRKEIKGKDAKALEGFDEDKFFSKTLRERAPYLFSVEERPANTSPAGSGDGGKPPGTPPGSPPVPPSKDVKTMKPEEFDELLRKRGLTPPRFGMAAG